MTKLREPEAVTAVDDILGGRVDEDDLVGAPDGREPATESASSPRGAWATERELR